MSSSDWPFCVLVVNPGSTSTKVAVFSGRSPTLAVNVSHSSLELSKFNEIPAQFEYRKRTVVEALDKANFDSSQLDAVVGRGGATRPVVSGVYAVNSEMIEDLVERPRTKTAANLGALIAQSIAAPLGIPALVVDPISVDEFEDLARLSGLPCIDRQSLVHALSVRSTALKTAEALGKRLDQINVIVAHLGGGISVCPVRHGRIVDANGANDEGPFSPERAGNLPAGDLVSLCFSGKYEEAELIARLTRYGGLVAHLGTSDAREVEKMINEGDARALEVVSAMRYQIAKEIGAMATVLSGEVDAIALTGGLAAWDRVVHDIIARCQFIAPVLVFPGENEMEALAFGAMRALSGEEPIRQYP